MMICTLTRDDMPLLSQWIKKSRSEERDFLVPLTGLEPVRCRQRGILSPLCLPIPPQRRTTEFYNILSLMSSIFKIKIKFANTFVAYDKTIKN